MLWSERMGDNAIRMKDQSQRACCKVSSRGPIQARQGVPPVHAEPADPLYVLFTVDVEVRSDGNVERDIWGVLPCSPDKHGIDQVMDTLERHGVKGTFFVDVFAAAKHGQEAVAAVCRHIVARGHDVQLHTHPSPVFGLDGVQDADLDTQVKILRQGAELIRGWTGVETIAHRAGAYMANLDTLAACRATGLSLELSYNGASHEGQLSRTGLTWNAAFARDGLLCVPVTCHVEVGFGPWKRLRFLDIESSSLAEIRNVLANLHRTGVRTAVIMAHSFSFCRGGKPHRQIWQAFDGLVAGLATDPRYKIVTAHELHALWQADPQAVLGPDHLPKTGLWTTYCRAWRRIGEGWKNVAVALLPWVAIGAAALAAWLHLRMDVLGLTLLAAAILALLIWGGSRRHWRRSTAAPARGTVAGIPSFAPAPPAARVPVDSQGASGGVTEAEFWDHAIQVDARVDLLGPGFYGLAVEEIWRHIFAQLGDLAGKHVLFVGCGTSSCAAKEMALRGADVWCLDISPKSIRRLMEHPYGAVAGRIHPYVGDAENTPFATGVFDVVIGKDILHHLDLGRSIAEVLRVCAPGGRIVFSEPLNGNPFIRLFRRLTPRLRTSTEHPLTRADLAVIARLCTECRADYHFLLALTSIPWFLLRMPRIGRAVFRLGQTLDQGLMRAFPPARRLAWSVTLAGRLNADVQAARVALGGVV